MGTKEDEERKIREYLKKVDKNYYRPDIKEKKSLSNDMLDTDEDTGRGLPDVEPHGKR